LDRKYTYLDDNFNITIPKDTFDLALKKYNFYVNKIKKHKDSVNIILQHELKDWDASRIASLRINYSWLRLGYHLWLSEEQTKKLGEKLNFKHPYKLKQFIIDDTNNSKERITIIENLKARMTQHFLYNFKNYKNSKKLLNFALGENPQRKRDFEKVRKKMK